MSEGGSHGGILLEVPNKEGDQEPYIRRLEEQPTGHKRSLFHLRHHDRTHNQELAGVPGRSRTRDRLLRRRGTLLEGFSRSPWRRHNPVAPVILVGVSESMGLLQ